MREVPNHVNNGLRHLSTQNEAADLLPRTTVVHHVGSCKSLRGSEADTPIDLSILW